MKSKLISILILSIFLIAGCAPSTQKSQPNVVFILVDQWSANTLGYTGDPNVKTPGLDAFTEKAVNFSNTVTVCPVCTPYRASLLTGRYPTSTGMFLNDAYLPAEELCLAEIYKNEGYQTAYFGKWHVDGHGRLDFTPEERRQGFDFWMALECSHDYNNMPYYENDSPEMKIWEGYSPFAVSKASQDYIISNRDNEKPFFLFASFATPHFPHHTALEEYKALYQSDELILNPNVPDDMHEKVREELLGYYAHCTATDKAIGDLISKLEELNMMENTIVVFTSDHGEMMGAHGINVTQKQVPFAESVKVPFLISVPGNTLNGKEIKMPVNTPDISATLLSLSGINIPDSFEGRDFSTVVTGQKEIKDQAALYMCVSSFALVSEEFKKEYRAIKTQKYTYVKDTLGAWLMFDDEQDPYQMNNLAGNPEYSEIQKMLDDKLMSELKNISDDFKPGKAYIEEWGFEVVKNGHIPYKMHDQEVQTPRKKNN